MTGQQKRGGIFGSSWSNFDSRAIGLNYTPRPLNDPDPCTLAQASTRGYTKIARQQPAQQLERNIRSGPQVQLYPASQLGPLLDPVLDPADLCVAATVEPASTCLTPVSTSGASDAIRNGLLTSGDSTPGRMIGDCGAGTTSSNGYSGIDGSRLVSSGSTLVDPAFGSGAMLRQHIVSRTAPPLTRGWVTAQALRCPRMAVLPVLADSASSIPVGLLGGKEITGFVYAWIDGIDADRGLGWNGSTLHSLSGYIIDPLYLPAVVAGSRVVGPYLGGDMPTEATLVCDLGERILGRCADAG